MCPIFQAFGLVESIARRRPLHFLIAVLLAVISAPAALAVIPIQNTTVSGTLSIPVGETGELGGVVTLDNGTIEVLGTLRSKTGAVRVTGAGQVSLKQSGIWNYDTATSLLIDPGVEVLGQYGTRFSTRNTTNRGTFAAVAGGASQDGFRVYVYPGFVNEGMMEARSGARLWFDALGGYESFNTTGTIRALPGGIVRFSGPTVNSLASFGNLQNLGGTIEFDGTLNNANSTTNFTGGDWVLMSGSHINGGTLSSSGLGRMVINPYQYDFFTDTEPTHFNGVTLASDLYFASSSKAELIGSLVNGTMHFNSGTGELQLPSSNVGGSGTILADGGTGNVRVSGGAVTVSPGFRSTVGTLSLGRKTGDVVGSYILNGPVDADGGTISFDAPVSSQNSIVVHNQGRLNVNSALTNAGSMDVQDGGVLNLAAAISNQGPINVDHGSVLVRTFPITGPGTVSITDSTLATGTSMTLAQFLAIGGTRVDRLIYSGTLDLQGGAIDIGAGGDNWKMSGGILSGGTVNSSSGTELLVTAPPTGLSSTGTGSLLNLELNANVRIPANRALNVTGPLTGTGRIIVDGGRLSLGSFQDSSFVAPLLDRITPIGGTVILTGAINNVGKTIRLKAGVEWQVSHLRTDVFIGGRVEGEAGAELKIVSGYGSAGYATMRQGVTLAIPTTILDATRLYVLDGLTLDHTTLTIGAPMGKQGVDAHLVLQNQPTLSGTGEIRFNHVDGSGNPMYPRIDMIEVTGGQPLTIGSGITIRTWAGSGYIGGSYFNQLPPVTISVVNQGTMIAENGNTLTIFASSFTQQGTLRADANSSLIVRQTSGANQGNIAVDGGTFAVIGPSYANAAGGVIAGQGVLDFSQTSFTNGGIVAPQVALNIHGNFAESAAGTLRFDVASDASGVSDVLAVDGNASLGGSAAVDFFGVDAPALGDSWLLLTAGGGVTGAFSAIAAPWLPADLALFVDYEASAVSAMLVARIAGDFNGDSRVDSADYIVWRRTGGTQADLDHWRANYGYSYGGGTSIEGNALVASVPEPGCVCLLAFGVLVFARFSRRPEKFFTT